jgi:HSP20 family protein
MLTMRDLIPWSRDRDVAAGRAAEHPLMSFQRDMNRLFEDLWRGFDAPLPGRGDGTAMTTMISPRIELKDRDGEIEVCAELPGLKENDVEVTLTDNVLSIRGEKKHERKEEEKGYTYSERSYGVFERRIPLEAEVMADRVEAKFADGVLTLTLPKNPQAQGHARRIPIGTAPKTEPEEAPKAA